MPFSALTLHHEVPPGEDPRCPLSSCRLGRSKSVNGKESKGTHIHMLLARALDVSLTLCLLRVFNLLSNST